MLYAEYSIPERLHVYSSNYDTLVLKKWFVIAQEVFLLGIISTQEAGKLKRKYFSI